MTTSGYGDGVRATLGKASGAYYWELTVDATGGFGSSGVGVTTATASLSSSLGSSAGAGLTESGTLRSSSGATLNGCGYAASDVIGIALDVDAGMIYFSINGVWQGDASPDAAQGGLDIDIVGEAVFPVVSVWSGDRYTVNFGQSTFAYAPPSGFEPMFE